ncbi:MAG: hypothetical protein FWC95_06345 [Defluviitaleaceae bacterium]|nr:hypothetical protein [Defluviitaleaceae bacterium]
MMKGPKIMVFHIRQLIKTAVFVVAGVAIILLLIWLLSPGGDGDERGARRDAPRERNRQAASFTLSAEEAFGSILFLPGTYRTAVMMGEETVYVKVTVDAFHIVDIALSGISYDHAEMFPLVNPILAALRHDILHYQSLSVSLPTEGPITGQILLDAVTQAINQAYAFVWANPGPENALRR